MFVREISDEMNRDTNPENQAQALCVNTAPAGQLR
jgi:hypothetical protein